MDVCSLLRQQRIHLETMVAVRQAGGATLTTLVLAIYLVSTEAGK